MKEFIKSLGICLGISMIFIFILSIIYCFSNVSENVIGYVMIGGCSTVLFLSSFIFSKKYKKHGMKNGIIISSIYFISLYIIACIINMELVTINTNSFIFIITGILMSIIGGITGVNLNK